MERQRNPAAGRAIIETVPASRFARMRATWDYSGRTPPHPDHEPPPPSTTHYPAAAAAQAIESHTLAVIVDNEPGVLARVIGLFSGRGYNIESLTVSETEHEKHLSRITIVTRGTPMVIEQIKNQLDRMVPIHRVVDMTIAGPAIERELAMVKVRGKGDNRVEALRLADAFRARVIDATTESFVFEITGGSAKIDAVRQPDAAARPRRGVAHRHRRDRARPGGDVSHFPVPRGVGALFHSCFHWKAKKAASGTPRGLSGACPAALLKLEAAAIAAPTR